MIILTIDTDWAPEEATRAVLARVMALGIKCTVFFPPVKLGCFLPTGLARRPLGLYWKRVATPIFHAACRPVGMIGRAAGMTLSAWPPLKKIKA